MARPDRLEAATALGFDTSMVASGSSTNGQPSYYSPPTANASTAPEQSLNSQQFEPSHQFGPRGLESLAWEPIVSAVDEHGRTKLPTRSPTSQSKGKWRADQVSAPTLQTVTPDGDTRLGRLLQDPRYADAVEDQTTPASQYPGPPPAQPPPLPPISPSQVQRSPTNITSPLQSQYVHSRGHSDVIYPESDNGPPNGSPSRHAASHDDYTTMQGPISPHRGSSSRPSDRRSSATADSPRSIKSPSKSRHRIPSKEILQTALNLAQQAVERDGANDIPGAIALYRDAVEKLRTVMGRVGLTLEPLSPDLGVLEPSEEEKADRMAAAGRRRASGASRSAEEGKTLMGIHDAYVARIALLIQMKSDGPVAPDPVPADISRQPVSSLSLYLSSPQSSTHTGSSRAEDDALHGFANTRSTGHRYQDAQHEKDIPLSAAHHGRPSTIVTDARPPISQRAASLSAYPRDALSTSASSPSSPSFGSEDRSRNLLPAIQSDISPAGASQSGRPSQLRINADVPTSSNMTGIPVPPRPARSPLRLSPQPGSQSEGNEGRFNGLEMSDTQQGTSSQRNSGDEASKARLRTGSGSSIQTLKAAPSSATSASVNLQPISPVHYPFHVLRQIRSSMTMPDGALVSQGLYVPRATWSVAGAKLPALDTKIRVMLLLSQNLNIVMESGRPLLETSGSDKAISADPAALRAFVLALDDLDALTVEIQKILVKKIGDGKAFAKPRKSNTSISTWGSKFSKTFDKMMTTTGKSLDSNATYNECLIRLCTEAQCIDLHLAASKDRLNYADSRTALESKLRRISGFFADVILRFVVMDLSLLLSRQIQQTSRLLLD